jgi:hypothetical protein
MGRHAMNIFRKRLVHSDFGMLMYEGDPAVGERFPTCPSRRAHGTATPPKIP